jgi:hemerythrin-like domain-containing protein
MIEHRLIEKMIGLLRIKSREFEQLGKADVGFIDTSVDFIRTYADRCHHGKEEDILFRELFRKKLSAEHKNMLDDLIQEHVYGRKTVAALVAARDSYAQGNVQALAGIQQNMSILVDFYPKHIEKEDKHFFLPVMGYFNAAEKENMLERGFEFDQKLIHLKYKEIVEGIGRELKKGSKAS